MARSHSVGLAVTNFADPFHSEIAQGVEEEAQRRQYSIYLASTTVDPARELAEGLQVDAEDGVGHHRSSAYQVSALRSLISSQVNGTS